MGNWRKRRKKLWSLGVSIKVGEGQILLFSYLIISKTRKVKIKLFCLLEESYKMNAIRQVKIMELSPNSCQLHGKASNNGKCWSGMGENVEVSSRGWVPLPESALLGKMIYWNGLFCLCSWGMSVGEAFHIFKWADLGIFFLNFPVYFTVVIMHCFYCTAFFKQKWC